LQNETKQIKAESSQAQPSTVKQNKAKRIKVKQSQSKQHKREEK
jgi:hypothetical protein